MLIDLLRVGPMLREVLHQLDVAQPRRRDWWLEHYRALRRPALAPIDALRHDDFRVDLLALDRVADLGHFPVPACREELPPRRSHREAEPAGAVGTRCPTWLPLFAAAAVNGRGFSARAFIVALELDATTENATLPTDVPARAGACTGAV